MGSIHPVTQVQERICQFFTKAGFQIAHGPEVEDDYHNFEALNIPGHHPARAMHDTFYFDATHLLRTHTSGVQVRTIEKWLREGKAFPLAVIVPGKVYRNEATDARHEAQFFQVEGLMVGKDITLANLKGVLEYYFTEFLEKHVEVRFRSSFFPFTEPSVEVDMQCFKCNGTGLLIERQCSLCSGSGWIEIMGAGMVHPNVLQNAGLNPKEYQGFAFGGGLDRLVMLQTGIDDIRMLYNGDLRLVNQF